MKQNTKFLILFLTCALLCSCEKMSLKPDDDEPAKTEDGSTIVLNLSQFEQIPFEDDYVVTRASTAISDLCSIINVAVFNGDEKVKTVTQKSDDADFGKISVSLTDGTYRIVIIAHNGSGSATITSPEKVTFANNKLTDTFSYCGDITVSGSGQYDITMKRVVAMFRLIINDNMPENVAQMKFYYTGGSSTLNPLTGYGCVNSRQTETRTVDASMTGKASQFEVFTFPHAESDEIKMTITALTSASAEVCEREFEKVPVKRNTITQYKGDFFNSSASASGSSFSLTTGDSWSQDNYTY